MPQGISPFDSVAALVTHRPERAPVFARWNIAYSNEDGNNSLLQTCATHGIDYNALLNELAACDRQDVMPSGCFLENSSLCRLSQTELANHVVDVHHAFLWRELPRLTYCLNAVAEEQGIEFPEIRNLQGALERFKSQIEAHLDREEGEIFPKIKQAAFFNGSSPLGSQLLALPSAGAEHCSPCQIESLVGEHAALSEQLRQMRVMTRGYTAPEGTSAAYQDLLNGLADVEVDVLRHFAEEEVLFNRALHEPVASASKQGNP